MLRTHLGDLRPPGNRTTVGERPEWFRKQTRLEVLVRHLQNFQFIIHRVCEPVAIPLLPHTVQELTYGVAKRKHNRLLSVNDRPTKLCLNAFILSDERFVESLFDEDGSQLTMRHRPILAVLWTFTASV